MVYWTGRWKVHRMRISVYLALIAVFPQLKMQGSGSIGGILEKSGMFADEAARYYDKWHYRFGIQTIALSAIVGTSVFASLEDLGGQDWKIILGLVSIISAATALSGLQTFLNFGARAETFVPRR